MEGSSWRPDLATADSSSGGGEWRQQLLPEARERIVNKIMDTLKRHLPISGSDGLSELKKIAIRFEEKIYAAATNQSDYLRKISLKMLSMETKTSWGTTAINPSFSNPFIGNPNPSESGSKILDQPLRDYLHEQQEQLKPMQTIQAQQLLRMQQMQQQQQLQQMQTQAQQLLQLQQKQQVLHQSLLQQQLHQQNHQQMAPMPVNPLTQLHQMNARQAFGAGLHPQNYPWGQNHNYYQPHNPGHNLSSHPTTGVPLLSANSIIGIAPEKQSGTSKFKISEKPRNVPQPQAIQGENVAAFKIRVEALQNRVTALEMRVWIGFCILLFVVFEVLFSNVMLE